MIFNLFLSIAVAFVFGCLLVGRAWPSRYPAHLIAVLALPAGWSLTSALYFLWLVMSDGRANWYPLVEILLLTTALVFTLYRYRKKSSNVQHALNWRLDLNPSTVLLSLALLIVASLCFAITVKLVKVNPWGYWDAWARINVKARFLFAGGEHWKWIFESSRIAHHDYPLLLECTVARSWAWMGSSTALCPQVLSIIWGIWSLVILYSIVAWLRTPTIAVIVSLAYLSFTPLLFWSSTQYPDIPLSCCMVLACAMMIAVENYAEDARHFALLAGFYGGSAAWCKNEGIAFAVLVVLWWGFLCIRKKILEFRRTTILFITGLGISSSAVVILKLAYAGKTDLIAGQPNSFQSVFALLTAGERHMIILQHLGISLRESWNGWTLLTLVIAFLLCNQWRPARIAHLGTLSCTICMFVIYYVVFATTPHDINWHIGTAIDRLILQLWPVMLLGLSVVLEGKSIEERARPQ